MKAQKLDWSDVPYVLAVCEAGGLSGVTRLYWRTARNLPTEDHRWMKLDSNFDQSPMSQITADLLGIPAKTSLRSP